LKAAPIFFGKRLNGNWQGGKNSAGPKTGRVRAHNYRVRKRNGEAVATVTYGPKVLDLLLTAGWLREEDASIRGRVGEALSSMLADAAKNL
jgi:hypothetical protein